MPCWSDIRKRNLKVGAWRANPSPSLSAPSLALGTAVNVAETVCRLLGLAGSVSTLSMNQSRSGRLRGLFLTSVLAMSAGQRAQD